MTLGGPNQLGDALYNFFGYYFVLGGTHRRLDVALSLFDL